MAKHIGSVHPSPESAPRGPGSRSRAAIDACSFPACSAPRSPHLYEFDPVEHAHLVPPDPTSDAESDASGHTDRKPKAGSGTPTSSAAGVHRADGRTKSAAEVDSADDED